MPERRPPLVAIVDYDMGNLFSVQQACARVGVQGIVTAERDQVLAADAVILPGVGAFGDAMATLRRLDLVSALRDVAASGRPFVGICLGMQLLMEESQEFGRHQGLGIVAGDVVRLAVGAEAGRTVKVPQVGWNRLDRAGGTGASADWQGSLLDGLADGVAMYFVHSFYPRPSDPGLIRSWTRHGPTTFCSTLQQGHVFACQYHPERSGPQGLVMYRNLAARLGACAVEVPHG